ncbi:hypothetical protein PR002_g27647 [Phytophthora rubi]|uniref:Uncharacterized protein n=1 Tax=Phytophthora rubi TaxID=129364 RepID=A0A6A3HJ73_9STRA|nr:hypothetical protein PR002_g27647 [Phytophthora rubi]
MPRSIVLLLPCDVPSLALNGPHYGEVMSRRAGDTARVRLLPKPGTSRRTRVDVSAEIVALRSVAPTEVDNGSPGWLLFHPVYFQHEDDLLHGQVSSYADGQYSVSTHSGEVQVAYDEVIDVAPVIVFLLWGVRLVTSINNTDSLQTAHSTLLNRLLGQRGARASRNIVRLMNGVGVESTLPNASTQRVWITPYTGERVQVTVGHVINVAFYIDGNRRPPASVNLGATFCDDPSQPPLPADAEATSTSTPPGERDAAREMAEDEAAESGFAEILNVYAESEHPAKRRRVTCPSSQLNPFQDPATHAILQALASKPRLLELYLDQLQGIQDATSVDEVHRTTEDCDFRRSNDHLTRGHPAMGPPATSISQLASVSDMIACEESVDRQGRFRPTRAQRDVHNAITSTAYAAVLSRLYEFLFGPCSLSILHFVRFDFQAQLFESEKKKRSPHHSSSKSPAFSNTGYYRRSTNERSRDAMFCRPLMYNCRGRRRASLVHHGWMLIKFARGQSW